MIIQYSAKISAGTDKFSHFCDMWEQHSRRRRQGIMTDMILLGKESERTIKVNTYISDDPVILSKLIW